MQKILLVSAVFFAVLFPHGKAFGFTLAPANDSVYNAHDLGALAAPGLCPNQPKGDYDSILGTTLNATYNQHYSSLYPFSNPSPDVWYKFRATGSFFYCEITGLNGFQNFYIKIHYSEGSSITLLPGQCATSSGNFLSASFPTPTLNGEYYLEIGGDSPSNTGDFFMKYKAYNDCSGCVRMATMDFTPAPVFGRYNPGDTVQMCVTVDRWSSLTSSYFHSIVPEFGSDWDLSSLIVVQSPITQESTGGEWSWFTGINTPLGSADGFFFDANSDGVPSNDHGDNGQVLSTWTGCWKIVANNPCSSGDLDVQIHLYSDAETGSGSAFSVCNPYDALEVATTSSCCAGPHVNVFTNGPCNSFTATINVAPSANAAGDTLNYYLLDQHHHVVQQFTNVMGPTNFLNVPPGQYYLWLVDVTNGNCNSYTSIVVQAPITTSIVQTSTGCGSGTGSAVVNVVTGGVMPFTYNWINVNAADQLDSSAFNLPDGWVHVLVTDANSCTVEDSVFITSQSLPDPTFSYDPVSYCVNTDTIPVLNTPPSPSGVFSLLSPQSAGIVVDPSNGNIFLNNTTHATPFYVYVSYSINGICSASYVDSVLIVAVPATPIASGSTSLNYCIGDPAPVLTVSVPGNTIGAWYDNQTTNTSLGNSFTPPLNSGSLPGVYLYGVVAAPISATGCTSAPVIYVINAMSPPTISSAPIATSICLGDTVQLVVNGCTTCNYLWTPTPTSGINNSQSTLTSPSGSVIYNVTATDQNGCSSSSTSDIIVQPCVSSNSFHIYSGLTPNGDGLNDAWVIDGIDSSMDIHVDIFNRWGVEVWESNAYDNNVNVFKGFDQNGNELMDGTYYYILDVNGKIYNSWIELSRK
jgi:gliding motility-associated-like protein